MVSEVNVGDVPRVGCWEERVWKVKVNHETVGRSVRGWVINQMANSVWVDHLWWYLNHLFICDSTVL
jgi:hypothetical protein